MGQILQDGKNACFFMSTFFKNDEIDLIFQLIQANWVLLPLETP